MKWFKKKDAPRELPQGALRVIRDLENRVYAIDRILDRKEELFKIEGETIKLSYFAKDAGEDFSTRQLLAIAAEAGEEAVRKKLGERRESCRRDISLIWTRICGSDVVPFTVRGRDDV